MTGRPQTPDVIVAGHICLDIIPTFGPAFARMDALFAPGSLIEVGHPILSAGGSVSNTGIALHKLGFATRLMGKIGDDLFGRAIIEVLNGLDSTLSGGMIVAEGELSSYTIVLNPQGMDRIFLHCPGANDTFSPREISMDLLRGARLFHFGYPPLMRQTFLHGGREMASLFQKIRASGLVVSLDMAQPDPNSAAGRVDWASWLSEVLPYVDVFAPSFDEILYMLDRPLFERWRADGDTEPSASRSDAALLDLLADRLLSFGCAVVVLKLGDEGLYLRTTDSHDRISDIADRLSLESGAWTDRRLTAPCFDVRVAGTTGAGDVTIAGFLAGMLNGASAEAAMTAGLAAGAYSVEQPDATSAVPCWNTLQDRVNAGWSRRPGN